MLTRVFHEGLNAFIDIDELKQLEGIDGGVASAGSLGEDDHLVVLEAPPGQTGADPGAGGPGVNWDDGFSGFGASP